MGTLVTVYIRANHSATADAIRREYPSAITEPGTTFYDIHGNLIGWEPQEEDLRDLSARLDTEVIRLAFQSGFDAFEFHRWYRGRCLRSLVFGCSASMERTWERAEGEAEPWERDAIFSPEELASWLEGAPADRAREYQRIWSEASLTPGQTEPCLDARETARAVAIYYRLPGWSDDWSDAPGAGSAPLG